MPGTGLLNKTMLDNLGPIGRGYSPVTLSEAWPKLGRLLFMVFCSCWGTTMNGFFVAAFFVEHNLKRIGNVFMACIGLADLMITTGVMPVSAVVLLSGEGDTVPVCQVLQFIATSSTYCYSLFFTLVATETYYRLCRSLDEYEMFISMRVGLIAIIVFGVSLIMAGLGVYLGLDYDYCKRIHHGNFYFRVITIVLFHGLPSLATMFCLISASIRVQRKAKEQAHYKRSLLYESDNSITSLNIAAFCMFVISWSPCVIISHEFPNASNSKFYHSVWFGMCRPVITSFMYGTVNRSFRRAFAHLFNYCCCKSTLSGSFSNRHRRALEYKPATGDVRVHIMHQAVSINSPQRAACSSRETQEL